MSKLNGYIPMHVPQKMKKKIIKEHCLPCRKEKK